MCGKKSPGTLHNVLYEVVQMAMPQRDETIEEIKRLDALLEYAVMHDDEAEAARLRAELTKLVEKV